MFICILVPLFIIGVSCKSDARNIPGYFLGEHASNFNAAKSYCEERGTTLALIKDEESQQNAAAKCGKHTCWIGLVEHGGQDGTWKWLDGETISYSNWNEGEPNNYQGNDEKNAIMNCCDEDVESPNGKWYDAPEGFESPRPLCEENVTTYQNPCVNGVQNATQTYNGKTFTVKCDYLDDAGQAEGIATVGCDTLLGKSPTNINEGCLETFKTTDHNTCKDFGMDIVIPRSKKHWEKLFAEYDNTDSYFKTVPGIYKPTDGGSFVNIAMNSDQMTAGGYRSLDGGRWWLRDTPYGEPNGDYQANCWLTFWQDDHKWNVDALKFNDGTCSYSTKKYVCSYNNGSSLESSQQHAPGSCSYTAVYNKGCNDYIHMDDQNTYGIQGGQTTLEQCAAAIKKFNGKNGCKGSKYFFYENGKYCNCPKDDCTTSPNNNAGGPGQLYEFTDSSQTNCGDIPETEQHNVNRDGFNPMENGFCIKEDGGDQNAGVIKLNSLDINTAERRENCLDLCEATSGYTGCEGIWNQANRGCYVHTDAVSRGNNAGNHVCWIRKNSNVINHETVDPNLHLIYSNDFLHGNDGWKCEDPILSCGTWGKVCRAGGNGATIERTFNVQPGKFSITLDLLSIDSYDNEYNSVYINGYKCFSKMYQVSTGEKVCGVEHWNDRKDHIVCNYELAGGTKLNIKITSTIDQNVEDESVGFTNLKIFGEENAQVVPKTSRSTKTDAEFCHDECLAKSFCCNDHTIGSNQKLSCSQACMIRLRGTSEDVCKSYCNDGQNGCSLGINGNDYRLCQKCNDLTDQCPHGVQNKEPCMAGCGMSKEMYDEYDSASTCIKTFHKIGNTVKNYKWA